MFLSLQKIYANPIYIWNNLQYLYLITFICILHLHLLPLPIILPHHPLKVNIFLLHLLHLLFKIDLTSLNLNIIHHHQMLMINSPNFLLYQYQLLLNNLINLI